MECLVLSQGAQRTWFCPRGPEDLDVAYVTALQLQNKLLDLL